MQAMFFRGQPLKITDSQLHGVLSSALAERKEGFGTAITSVRHHEGLIVIEVNLASQRATQEYQEAERLYRAGDMSLETFHVLARIARFGIVRQILATLHTLSGLLHSYVWLMAHGVSLDEPITLAKIPPL